MLTREQKILASSMRRRGSTLAKIAKRIRADVAEVHQYLATLPPPPRQKQRAAGLGVFERF